MPSAAADVVVGTVARLQGLRRLHIATLDDDSLLTQATVLQPLTTLTTLERLTSRFLGFSTKDLKNNVRQADSHANSK
jgi:hypothetical protein